MLNKIYGNEICITLKILQTEPQKNQREEWMLELPPTQAVALGLGPRKFKTREGPDMSDRSMWTDTPADRLRKQQEKVRCDNSKFHFLALQLSTTCG